MYVDSYSNPADPFIDAERRVVNRTAYGTRPDVQIFSADNALQFDFATGAFQHLLLAGADYGQGSSRDWAAKGVRLAGVEAIVAEGFERIHRTRPSTWSASVLRVPSCPWSSTAATART
ncbi:hypothetical protein G6F66_014879 [Rhizopus arrhizus]|nr:hypothetical protein G6F66_014879 [Rhizopus arrhizus]